jgi:hypothetical protein
MKLIRTRVRNVIGDADCTAIAKAMINIYHGRKFFQEDGTPVQGATLDNTPETYLEWEEEGMTYNYRPVRGFIYVNFAAGVYDTSFKGAIVRAKLLQEFQRLNHWGWRKEIYTDHAVGSNQFTIEKYNALCYTAAADMVISVGNAFHTKYREYKFQWIISSEPSLFQYTVPGKFPKQYNLIASTTTIAIDVAHTVSDLEPNYRSVGFPKLTKVVDVVPRVLNLSHNVGVDGHIYTLIGGSSPDSKCWSDFMEYTRTLEKKPLLEYQGTTLAKKVHLVKDLQSLQKADGDADDDGSRCTACRVDVFDRYYQVSRDGNHAVICKFCAHFNPKVNKELQTGNYKVAVAQSPTTAASLIEIAAAGTERDVLRHLHQEVQRGTLKFVSPQDGDELHFITKCHSGGIVTKSGATTIVGLLQSKQYQDVLEQVHLFPDQTRVFEYRPSW